MTEHQEPKPGESAVKYKSGVHRCYHCGRASKGVTTVYNIPFCDRAGCKEERKAALERGYVIGFEP